MEKMACSVGGLIHIDFKNPEEPVVEKVPSDFEAYKYSLCIVDTKEFHDDLTEDYAEIPAEMKKVAAFLRKSTCGVDDEEFFSSSGTQKRVRRPSGTARPSFL